MILTCATAMAAPAKWLQSYDAGYLDTKGHWAGGSEIMHLASHKRKLYAANGYWLDARWVIPPEGQKQSAQVLRLDKANGQWQVDLDLGKANDLGLEYMKGNILKSVTFTRDNNGRLLNAPVQLLVMAAGANFERGGAVSTWIRNDDTEKWDHTLVRHGSNAVFGLHQVDLNHICHMKMVVYRVLKSLHWYSQTNRLRFFLLFGVLDLLLHLAKSEFEIFEAMD